MKIDRTRKAPRTPRRRVRLAGSGFEPVTVEPVEAEEKPAPKPRRARKAAEEGKSDG